MGEWEEWPQVEYEVDRSPAEWLRGQVRDSGRRVGDLVPDGYERLIRILHPASAWDPFSSAEDQRTVRWEEVGEWSGVALSAGVGFGDIGTRPDGTRWTDDRSHHGPLDGSMDEDEREPLARLLASETSTPDRLWYLSWEGEVGPGSPVRQVSEKEVGKLIRRFEDPNLWERLRWRFRRSPPQPVLPLVSLSDDPDDFRFVLYRNDLTREKVWRPHDPDPRMWWPEDRRWFVQTGYEACSTYVAGPASVTECILADDRFEAIPVTLDDPIDPGFYEH